jgi:hypothetical protein
MPRIKISGYATLVIGFVIFGSWKAKAQSGVASVDTNALSQPWATPVLGQPYSATKYERTVRTLPDGSQVTLKEEDSKVARDADGRIYLDVKGKCPQESPAPPWCGTHEVILFDSAAPSITPWLWGANAGPGATVLRMTPPQLLAAMSLVKEKTQNGEPLCTAATITSDSLGQQVIESVSVTGTRTTTTIPAGCAVNEGPISVVREVWTSSELKLDMKVVVRDTRKGETISGLRELSRNPDAALFRPPDGYSVNHNNRGGEFAEFYLEKLAKAGVQ